MHKKALRARKRSSRRGIYSCAIRSRAKVCVKRTLCSYIDIIFSAEKKLLMKLQEAEEAVKDGEGWLKLEELKALMGE